MARLKVFVVPTGFHDAYVAAPSRKAALEAWGSEHDLFARGIAQVVTDPALMAEPLANPGTVVKRSRGTTAEQIAALPDPTPRSQTPAKVRKTVSKGSPRTKTRPPKPSRDALDRTEQTLADAETRRRDQEQAFAERQIDLETERRKAAETWEGERRRLSSAIEMERARYDRDIRRWRG